MFTKGQKIENFTLLDKIGEGSFGVVWLAEMKTQIITQRVAVKLPVSNSIDINSFKQEASLWVEVSDHPNVLRLITADIFDGQILIASQYAEDGTLETWMTDQGTTLTAQNSIKMVKGILEGLKHIHSKGILHRDLKPANVLIKQGQPLIADFGLARLKLNESKTNKIAGSPAYMSPEIWESGDRCIEADLWAVGIMLYELLARRKPFVGSPLSYKICNELYPPLPDGIPEEINKLIGRALEKNKLNRFRSAVEMIDAINRLKNTVIEVPREVDDRREGIKSRTKMLDGSAAIHKAALQFHCGPFVPPEFFVGRSDEISKAHNLINAGKGFLISGDPRSGKTSFLRRILDDLSRNSSPKILGGCINLELGEKLDIRNFMLDTLTCIFGEMSRHVFKIKYSELLQSIIKSDKTELQPNEDLLHFKRLFRLVKQYQQEIRKSNVNSLLHDYISITNELLDLLKRRDFNAFVMFYDEANRLSDDMSFGLLNTLSENLCHTGLIASYVVGPHTGVKLMEIPGMVSNCIQIGAFGSIHDLRSLLKKYYFGDSEANSRLPITEDAFNRIWGFSKGYPYLIQLLSSQAFTEASREDVQSVQSRHVEQAYKILQRERPEVFK